MRSGHDSPEEFMAEINREVVAERKVRRHTLFRNVALGVAVWVLIYILFRGVMSIIY